MKRKFSIILPQSQSFVDLGDDRLGFLLTLKWLIRLWQTSSRELAVPARDLQLHLTLPELETSLPGSSTTAPSETELGSSVGPGENIGAWKYKHSAEMC